MTTIKINLRNGAITQHSNGFTSYAPWNGLQMGAGPDGVFLLNYGQKDIYTLTSDERNISAWFELPNTQLGVAKVKQGRRLYVGGEFNGSMTIKATTGIVENIYNITPVSASSSSLLLNMVVIDGFIIPSIDGTIQLQFASEIANSAITIKAGSTIEVW